MLHTVEGSKRCTCRAMAHDYLSSFHLVEVKAVERLAHAEKYEVGDVDNVVNWTLADGVEQCLQPLGALGDLDAADCQTAITWTGRIIVDFHSNSSVGTVDGKSIDRWTHYS